MHGFILSTAFAVALVASSSAREPTVRMTTDTTEYCRSLAARVAALPNAGEEPVRSIAAEGVRLCHNGHVRTGVAKLRRALRVAQPPAAASGS